MNAELTREDVMSKFARDDRFAVSLLIELFDRQTADEQAAEATGHDNGIGFNGTDAGFLSSLAKQAIARRAAKKAGECPAHWTDLSDKQMSAMRKAMNKYGRQLTDITNAQVAARQETGNFTLRGEVRLPGTVVADIVDLDDVSPYGTLPPTTVHPLPVHLQPKAGVGECSACGGKGYFLDGSVLRPRRNDGPTATRNGSTRTLTDGLRTGPETPSAGDRSERVSETLSLDEVVGELMVAAVRTPDPPPSDRQLLLWSLKEVSIKHHGVEALLEEDCFDLH